MLQSHCCYFSFRPLTHLPTYETNRLLKDTITAGLLFRTRLIDDGEQINPLLFIHAPVAIPSSTDNSPARHFQRHA